MSPRSSSLCGESPYSAIDKLVPASQKWAPAATRLFFIRALTATTLTPVEIVTGKAMISLCFLDEVAQTSAAGAADSETKNSRYYGRWLPSPD
jgi:hypothetical protein